MAADAGRLRRRRVRGEDPRQGDPHRAHHDVAVRHAACRKVALPRYEDDGEILRWQLLENVPGSFPFTAGVFAFKRENEDPTRMFAGEGDPFRTNRRFHLLADGMPAKRLSTAFDSVTLYGNDPDRAAGHLRQGRQIGRVDRHARRHEGALLRLRPVRPNTSVSMTINGPAPTILAMFLNTAIDQQLDKFRADNGREPTDDEAAKIREWTLATVRGTVQADILKEDQGQNTCIFSTEFSLKVMGDIQEYFVHHNVRNFYSVSISGYHIAEAGREPDLAARVHAGQRLHLRRGLPRARHAHRRLRAEPVVLLQQRHGPGVHGDRPRRAAHLGGGDAATATAPTSARRSSSTTRRPRAARLHAQEIAFNDIRTTLQALIATYDNTNSLHTNAYDEAITTPTEESVRRAMAIQLIINREWGLGEEREPEPGRVHHRGADRPGRGGGAEGVRGDHRARRRAGRDGDRLPARQDPGRVDVLRAPEARRLVPDRRRQHLPQSARPTRAPQKIELRALDRGGEAVAAAAPARLPGAARGRGAGGARAAEAGR